MNIAYLITVIAFLTPSAVGFIVELGSVLEVIGLAFDVKDLLTQTWDLIEGNPTEEEQIRDQLNLIANELHEMSEKVDDISISVQSIEALLEKLPDKILLEIKLYDLTNALNIVDVNFKRMQDYWNLTETLEIITLEDFASSILSHEGDSIINLMEQIFLFFVPNPDISWAPEKGLFDIFAEQSEDDMENLLFCNAQQQSSQQFLMTMHRIIATSELKGYTMVQYALMVLTLQGKGNFTEERKLLENRFSERLRLETVALQKATPKANKVLRRCDPPRHIKGQTYDEITELLQGYIQNEVDITPDRDCKQDCGHYQNTMSYGCTQEEFCENHKICNGRIMKCVDYGTLLHACNSDLHSERRYDFIYAPHKELIFGNTTNPDYCANEFTIAESWKSWFVWCTYCTCICDDPTYSDRYFNLRPYVSDIDNNMVVTGVRFKKFNQVIHLQIQQGKLLPNGIIDPNSLQWMPLHDYSVNDRHVIDRTDYYMMDYENRAIDLDDLVLDPVTLIHNVITGVRFNYTDDHLRLEISYTKFDFTTGKLLVTTTKQMSNPNSHSKQELNLVDTYIPINSPYSSEIDSSSGMYLKFTHTGLTQDAAQTTVPFIDIQEVKNNVPVPLSGVGIYHKGTEEYGGFVAPKIITYDYTQLVDLAVDQQPETKHVSSNITININ